MVELTVMRHAEARKNLDDVHGGGDQNLTEAGRSQAAAAASAWLPRLSNLAEGVLLHQPEGRCEQTAQIISAVTSLVAVEVPEFVGVRLGVTAGLSDDEVERRFPVVAKQLSDWISGRRVVPPVVPGSEGLTPFASRITDGLNRILKADGHRHVLLVCTTSTANMIGHLVSNGGALKSDEYRLSPLGLGKSQTWSLEVKRSGKWTVLSSTRSPSDAD